MFFPYVFDEGKTKDIYDLIVSLVLFSFTLFELPYFNSHQETLALCLASTYLVIQSINARDVLLKQAYLSVKPGRENILSFNTATFRARLFIQELWNTKN